MDPLHNRPHSVAVSLRSCGVNLSFYLKELATNNKLLAGISRC